MWIEHDGKSEPDLKPGTLVYIQCRDGFEDMGLRPFPWDHWKPSGPKDQDQTNYWLHDGSGDDIVAYCLADD